MSTTPATPHRSAAAILSPTEGELLAIIGDRARLLADGGSTGGQCAIFEAVTAPGAGPPLHRHAREEEYFYIIDGRVKFHVDGRETVATAGSFVLAPRGSVHTFMNVGERESRMLISVTPAGLEIPFRECAALMARDPDASPAAIEAIFRRAGVEFVGPPLAPHA